MYDLEQKNIVKKIEMDIFKYESSKNKGFIPSINTVVLFRGKVINNSKEFIKKIIRNNRINKILIDNYCDYTYNYEIKIIFDNDINIKITVPHDLLYVTNSLLNEVKYSFVNNNYKYYLKNKDNIENICIIFGKNNRVDFEIEENSKINLLLTETMYLENEFNEINQEVLKLLILDDFIDSNKEFIYSYELCKKSKNIIIKCSNGKKILINNTNKSKITDYLLDNIINILIDNKQKEKSYKKERGNI